MNALQKLSFQFGGIEETATSTRITNADAIADNAEPLAGDSAMVSACS